MYTEACSPPSLKAVKPSRAVDSAKAEIDASAERIGALVVSLADRLYPVLAAPNPSDCSEKGVGYAAPLANDLQAIDAKLNSAIYALRDLLDRLEI